MDSHMIQVQCELLEREITAERNLLQAQEQLKAIRTMRRRVLAMVGNQGHTPIGLCPPEVHMTPNASTPASPVLTINVTDLPDEHKETKDSRNHRPISLNTPPRLGYPCSEPDITPLLTPEAQPQSAPANHHLTDTTTYTYEDHLQLSSGTASGCLKFAHSESPGVALTGCSSGIPPGTSYVDYELDHYIKEYAHIRNETKRLMSHISYLQDVPNTEDEINSAEDALSLICEQWASMLGNISQAIGETAESAIFIQYETMIQALLSINPYLAPNFVPSCDIPWPILCPSQDYPPKLTKPSTYGRGEIINFITAYDRWSRQNFSTTVRSMLKIWTVISARFRSGDLNIQVGMSAGIQRGYAMGLMKKVLKVLNEPQCESHGDIKLTQPSPPGTVLVSEANSKPPNPSNNNNPTLQLPTNSVLSTQVVFSPRYTSSAVTSFSNTASAANLLAANVSDSLPMQMAAPPYTRIDESQVEIFLLYDSLIPKAIAAGKSVMGHELPWPVLQFRAKSSGKPYSPRYIYGTDITPPAVASFVRTYCAWKGWSLQVGHKRMLEDWSTIQRAFPAGKAGAAKVRQVLGGISSIL